MTNIFESVSEKVKNSKIVIWIFAASVAMLIVGVNHFVEDTLSSFYGIKMLEQVLGMRPVSYEFTYGTMSIAPQVAQIVFAYIFMSDTRKNRWAIWTAFLALLVDFFADSWYRSNAGLFEDPTKFFASVLLTSAYFTVGSEGFITVGLGITLELMSPAIKQMAEFLDSLVTTLFGSNNKQVVKNNGKPSPQQMKSRPQRINKFGKGVDLFKEFGDFEE